MSTTELVFNPALPARGSSARISSAEPACAPLLPLASGNERPPIQGDRDIVTFEQLIEPHRVMCIKRAWLILVQHRIESGRGPVIRDNNWRRFVVAVGRTVQNTL